MRQFFPPPPPRAAHTAPLVVAPCAHSIPQLCHAWVTQSSPPCAVRFAKTFAWPWALRGHCGIGCLTDSDCRPWCGGSSCRSCHLCISVYPAAPVAPASHQMQTVCASKTLWATPAFVSSSTSSACPASAAVPPQLPSPSCSTVRVFVIPSAVAGMGRHAEGPTQYARPCDKAVCPHPHPTRPPTRHRPSFVPPRALVSDFCGVFLCEEGLRLGYLLAVVTWISAVIPTKRPADRTPVWTRTTLFVRAPH